MLYQSEEKEIKYLDYILKKYSECVLWCLWLDSSLFVTVIFGTLVQAHFHRSEKVEKSDFTQKLPLKFPVHTGNQMK